MEDELFVVSSAKHPLANKDKVPMKDLQNQAWITREIGSGTREYLDHVIRSNALKVGTLLTISSNQAIKETVINGMGLTLLSKCVIERDIQAGNLSAITLEKEVFKRTLSYVYSPIMKEKQNVKTFIQALNKKYPFHEEEQDK